MKAISLFAGCGGLDFGIEAAGAELIYANEIDADACATLAKYFRKTEIDQRDIKDVEHFPKADLLVGGYPCQSFSMGGNRNPHGDSRTYLYLEFARCLAQVRPKFFIAENVSGLRSLDGGSFLGAQRQAFESAGPGYNITAHLIDARDYGVPQRRKRVFLVGVRRDLRKAFAFPAASHGKLTRRNPLLKLYASHGEAIKDLPLWPTGEFYERPHDPEGHFSWYYMSRNRKAKWDGPSFTIVANWRHVTLHPASPVMTLTWSNLADGWKQRWDFSGQFEHVKDHPGRPVLHDPRRLSWRECARLQTFPRDFEPAGSVESKFSQIGNAVPPLLGKAIAEHLLSGKGLISPRAVRAQAEKVVKRQLNFW
jgi:DNA (cytosine-5)-methyltransferase 1